MKCPYKTPIEAFYSISTQLWLIRDKEGELLFSDLTEQQADYIVQAINSYEKLVNACEKAKWLYDMTNWH